LTIDSMTFDTRTKTFRYYYSLSPNFEYRNLDIDLCHKELLSQLKNRTTLRIYKEAGYSFRYIYYPLQDPKNIVLDLCFTRADYNTSSQP
ncbi:MAG: hypothetical protein HUK08_05635, partial [Bacteroidaceae bacterium]|nr:hypothetical protein [Bacteroidaceae bacterium]